MWASVWSLGTALALVSTLDSLSRNDFDGLNNLLQIPFALPWFLIPIGTSNHVVDAWVVALFGWFNAAILCVRLSRRRPITRS